MDDDLPQLEAELKRLRPATASPRLNRRLAEALTLSRLQRQPRVGAARVWWAWVVVPAVAAVMIFSAIAPRPASSEKLAANDPVRSEGAIFKPIRAENLLFDARDEGFLMLSDGTPARRVRQSYVETITWKNPRTNASLTWSLPREEVRIVPVVFQ